MPGDTTPIPFLIVAAVVVVLGTIIFVARAMHSETVQRRTQRGHTK